MSSLLTFHVRWRGDIVTLRMLPSRTMTSVYMTWASALWCAWAAGPCGASRNACVIACAGPQATDYGTPGTSHRQSGVICPRPRANCLIRAQSRAIAFPCVK